jgi:hypothetical protein
LRADDRSGLEDDLVPLIQCSQALLILGRQRSRWSVDIERPVEICRGYTEWPLVALVTLVTLGTRSRASLLWRHDVYIDGGGGKKMPTGIDVIQRW